MYSATALSGRFIVSTGAGKCELGMCELAMLRANLHFTLWMCIADDSSKVKGVKAVFIRISSKVTSEQSSARLYF